MEEKIWPLSWKGDVIWIWMKKKSCSCFNLHTLTLIILLCQNLVNVIKNDKKMSYGICFMCCVSYNVKCWKIQSKIYCQRRSGALVDGCVSTNVRLTVVVRSSPLCRRPVCAVENPLYPPKMFLPAGGWAANACARSGGEGEEGEQEAGWRRCPAEDPGGRGDYRAPAEEAGRHQAGACLSRGAGSWETSLLFHRCVVSFAVVMADILHLTSSVFPSDRPFMLWSWTQLTHCEGRWSLDIYKL